MQKRLTITIQFTATKELDVKLYNKLKEYSNPSAIIKDILMGKLSLNILEQGSED